MNDQAIPRELERGDAKPFGRSPPHARVFGLAEARSVTAQLRSLLRRTVLKYLKITRRPTTEWFARRVDERYKRCLASEAATLTP